MPRSEYIANLEIQPAPTRRESERAARESEHLGALVRCVVGFGLTCGLGVLCVTVISAWLS